MADGLTYGINFPFRDSIKGTYFKLTETTNDEIRTDLTHLLLTRKGSRYFLPNFGTRLLEYIFEPLDGPTFSEIESEIRESVEEYIENLIINEIKIEPASNGLEDKGSYVNENNQKVFSVPNISNLEHTAKIRIDYTITDGTFNQSDFIIINV
jgi:phage baseplate assembly protein W